jgi:hypothetical protein
MLIGSVAAFECLIGQAPAKCFQCCLRLFSYLLCCGMPCNGNHMNLIRISKLQILRCTFIRRLFLLLPQNAFLLTLIPFMHTTGHAPPANFYMPQQATGAAPNLDSPKEPSLWARNSTITPILNAENGVGDDLKEVTL